MSSFIERRLTKLAVKVLKHPKVQGAIADVVRKAVPSPDVTGEVHRVLSSPDMQRKLWHAANVRPYDDAHANDYAALRVGDIERTKYELATRASAEFALRHCPDAPAYATPVELLKRCVEEARALDGFFAEFGVYHGGTINIISSLVPDREVHGFDSFEGLPESWRDCGKGAFSTAGALPQVGENVRLHVGWFDQTLLPFLDQVAAPAAFVHIDSDLYSSAKFVLNALRPRLVKGSVILFDEFFNYPSYEEHEYKAFFEFVEETRCRYTFLGYAARSFGAAVRIESI
ncbi:MAG: class I SAM-dependent methyltransferase [Myxococcales bacterium]